MTVKRLFVLAMAGAAALGVASAPAQAGYLVTGTSTATIASGNDSSNIFGLNGASLAGYAMTLNYSYDTSLMSGSAASGMVNYTGSTPGIISATLTINGYTVVADGNSASGGGNGSFVAVNNSGGGKYYVATFLGSGNTLIGPQNFGSPGNWTPTTLNNPFSNLSAGGGGLYVNAGAGFDILNWINPSETGSVTESPEPASMALMISGLAGLGYARRRRRAAQRV